MQLTSLEYEETGYATPGDAAAPPSPAMAEYEARRCAVCNGRYPSFGFGPPLSRKGATLWACFAHRGEVDRQLTASGCFTPGKAPASETDLSRVSEKQAPGPSVDDSAARSDDRQASLF